LFQSVLSDGTTISVTVASAGEQDVYGGTASGTQVQSGATQYVYSGTANGTLVSNGAYQDAFDTTSLTMVSSGGVEIVESGATANSTTVLSGGEIVVYSGATVNGLILSSGATEVLLSSGGVFADAAAIRGGAFVPALSPAMKSASAAASPAEVTVAHLIHAMASFGAGAQSPGALFDTGSAGALAVASATLAVDHHLLTHH
jgi:autotransporter passenger strand-loop-strand repeat protein